MKRTKAKKAKRSMPSKTTLLFLSGLIVIVLTVGNSIIKNNRRKLVYAQIKKIGLKLVEDRPVLSSSMFSGSVAYAYKLASEIPEIIDKQFCYCYCRKNHGHKTLLTCFTGMHGSKCDICMNEVFMANDLLKKGYGIKEIVARIDEYFEKIAREHASHTIF